MNKLTLASIAIFATLFAGCGGGSSNTSTGGGGTGGGGTGGSRSVPFTCNPQAVTLLGTTYKVNMGAEGDIQLNCSNSGFFQGKYKLANGIASMNVTQVTKETQVNMVCSDGNGKGTIFYDYTAGTITYSGTYNGRSLTCTDRYQSPLETTISDNDSISDLLDDWGDDKSDPSFISSNCPNEVDDSDDAETNCRGVLSQDTHVTDGSGKIHKISTKATLTQ